MNCSLLGDLVPCPFQVNNAVLFVSITCQCFTLQINLIPMVYFFFLEPVLVISRHGIHSYSNMKPHIIITKIVSFLYFVVVILASLGNCP